MMNSKDKKNIELIKSAIESSPIENKKYVRTIKVIPNNLIEGDYSVKVDFQYGILDSNKREAFMKELWETIYKYTNLTVNLKFDRQDKPINEQEDKTPKILEKFMENLDVEGICGFWIDDEEDIHGKYWVYIILDSDMMEGTKPGFVKNRYANNLKSEIKKFTNIDVEIGTVSRRCSEVTQTH